jgi:hypothetical protein
MIQVTGRVVVAKAKSKIGGGAKGSTGLPSTRGVSEEKAAAKNRRAESATAEKKLADLLTRFREIVEDSSSTLAPDSSTKRKLEYAYAAFRATMEGNITNFASQFFAHGTSPLSATPLTAFPLYYADQCPTGFVGFLHVPPFHLEPTQIAAGENEPRGCDPQAVMPPERPRSTLELASDLLANPGQWLRTPNPNLGNRKPVDLIDTEEEYKVYDLLSAVDQGLFS